jgi:hypothetical protein
VSLRQEVVGLGRMSALHAVVGCRGPPRLTPGRRLIAPPQVIPAMPHVPAPAPAPAAEQVRRRRCLRAEEGVGGEGDG